MRNQVKIHFLSFGASSKKKKKLLCFFCDILKQILVFLFRSAAKPGTFYESQKLQHVSPFTAHNSWLSAQTEVRREGLLKTFRAFKTIRLHNSAVFLPILQVGLREKSLMLDVRERGWFWQRKGLKWILSDHKSLIKQTVKADKEISFKLV